MASNTESDIAQDSVSLASSHTPDLIQQRLKAPTRHSYLRDFVYGAIDGTVTTFAVVSGVAGAGLSSGVIIVLGLANLVGDGFSMAASNYLGTKTEEELRAKQGKPKSIRSLTILKESGKKYAKSSLAKVLRESSLSTSSRSSRPTASVGWIRCWSKNWGLL